VGTGQESKQLPKSTLDPSCNTTTKLALPVAPPGEAFQTAPPTRLMSKLAPFTTSSADATAVGRFEKITFVYHALSPSSTVAKGPWPFATSQSTGSYVMGKTPVLAPVIASNASTWQSKVLALPESTICTTMLPGRPESVASLPSYDTRKHAPHEAPC